ncbi:MULTISPECIES: hypothetical protein [Bradyrhizobium]|uniref:hypothetical protein n=1 Tax=Bradyrhizobium TaxID=374 RepID=UPI000231CB67|nr:hypothetical protein [Bradyrhizobium japonicum]AJA61041.1 hypothetical protein RN69_12175 [Bradyrhizobium japonicum]KMJ99692.1 hypothetical protein CF64_10985 [Bradyrhizobium japonicum]MCS3533931.1 hypothetical protein [Bradyrhizobium japonicum]MCS3989975.1 hypothetical protein [Bradyrhizobium japonicum]MCS4015212.1 hypothetical protein [Bradyrhizobium japonicum]
MSGEAFQMRVQLAKLASRYKIAPRPTLIPLTAPVDHALTVDGLASTTDIDLERTKFRAYAFCNPCLLFKGRELPPLLYKHDESQPAGKIESLTYDARGNLKISAHVTHELAKRCGAFSIRAYIGGYELRDTDSAHFHALVTNAEIIEISLTDAPANPHALVQRRYPAPPLTAWLKTIGETNALLIRRVAIVREMMTVLAKTPQQRTPKLAPAKHPPRNAPVPIPRRPTTEFSKLVLAINRSRV